MPSNVRVLSSSDGGPAYVNPTGTPQTVAMSAQAISTYTGGSQAHNNLMPYLGLNFCIALQGIFPSRS